MCTEIDISNFHSNPQFNVEFDPKEIWPFIEGLYLKLNEYCENNSLNEETNKEISSKIISFYTDGKVKL